MNNIVMTNEIWKDIEGYDGVYMVSNLGRVKNCQRNRVLKPRLTGGYYMVALYKKGERSDVLIHRLVALHFISNKDNLPFVHHKDEQKFNNVVSNLEWVTAQYNSEFSLGRNVVLISPDGISTTIFGLQRFCRDRGLHYGNICKLLSGERNHVGGWRRYE